MIKPPIKYASNKFSICSWILEKFPEQYEQMRYIEPFIGNGSILLNKIKSQEEVVADLDQQIIDIWRVIRDENKNMKAKLTKLAYTEKYFELVKNKKTESDYFKDVIVEFVLRKMSKNGLKQNFEQIERKKISKFWKETCENISNVQERIKDVYFVSRKPIEIIKSFNSQNTLCFCCPPPMSEDNQQMTTDDYVNITDAIKSFRGKVVFCGNNCTFYKRIFTDWKVIKNKNNTKKNELIWINF